MLVSSNHTPIKFSTVFDNILDFDFWKGVAMALIALLGSFIAPIYLFVLGSTSLVVIDYFTGKKAAFHRGEAITPSKMRRSIDKGLVYMTFILACHIVDVVFAIPYNPLSYLSAVAVSRVELFSIDGNVHAITGVSIKHNISQLFSTLKQKQ